MFGVVPLMSNYLQDRQRRPKTHSCFYRFACAPYPPDSKDDKALHTALDLMRGIQKNSAYPPNPKTAVPN